jgi:aryl-alcohol dehydrogenase-like predicted oxidoreductase
MEKRRLGENGPVVSCMGLGCMGMSEFYGASNDDQSKKVILAALEKGITLLDTADTYGDGHNEQLIASVLKDWNKDVTIATKFGIVREPGRYERRICGRPEYVRKAAEESLKRLNVETIDLYYLHRRDLSVPIEDTVGAMSDLVREGKVRHIGLSEVSVKTVEKAHAVHPLACVQTEYSLFTRQVEPDLLPFLREKRIGLVAYSPLGRGLVTGKLTPEKMADPKDLREFLPRTSRENYSGNMELVLELKKISDSKGITLSQLALAWILAKGEDIVPIPGTRHVGYLLDNLAAADIRLDENEMVRIDEIFHPGAVKGERYTSEGMKGIDG